MQSTCRNGYGLTTFYMLDHWRVDMQSSLQSTTTPVKLKITSSALSFTRCDICCFPTVKSLRKLR
jgi:hypothetical protein